MGFQKRDPNAPKLTWVPVDCDTLPPELQKMVAERAACVAATKKVTERFEPRFLALYEQQCGALSVGKQMRFGYLNGIAVAIDDAKKAANTLSFAKKA